MTHRLEHKGADWALAYNKGNLLSLEHKGADRALAYNTGCLLLSPTNSSTTVLIGLWHTTIVSFCLLRVLIGLWNTTIVVFYRVSLHTPWAYIRVRRALIVIRTTIARSIIDLFEPWCGTSGRCLHSPFDCFTR